MQRSSKPKQRLLINTSLLGSKIHPRYIRESSAKLRQAFKEADARAELKRQIDAVAAKNATIKVVRYDNGRAFSAGAG